MNYLQKRGPVSAFLALLLLSSIPSWCATKKSDGQVIDSGTFGIYVNGKRVASEKFEITQSPELSVARAELKPDQAKNGQTAEMQLSSTGNLVRYEWNEKDVGSAVVEPKDDFLVEHLKVLQPAKSLERPFLLPTSTLIQDDFFFSHRQILLWRYLATQCHPAPNEKGCQLAPTQFGVIVPRQQTSAQITVQYGGPEKVQIKGSDMDLTRFELKVDGSEWKIWMDQAYKVQKISIEADHTEVYRD